LTESITLNNINIRTANQGLIYNFVEQLYLKNVFINSERQDGTFERKQEGFLPPEQT
jgi:hypothetical protein